MENAKLDIKLYFGLENLLFYEKGSKKQARYHCKFTSQPNSDDTLDQVDLEFLLKSLEVQQGTVFFDDYGKNCTGIDELKSHLLIMQLAGL